MSLPTIVIAGTFIKQDAKGRFSLNDLHKASGGNKGNQPAFFMRRNETEQLIAELLSSANSQSLDPVKKILGKGKEQGTYVVKELVYAYAMWNSPAFHLKVIRTFDAVASGHLAAVTAPKELPKRSTLAADLKFIDTATRTLNLTRNDALKSFQAIAEKHGIDTNLLPASLEEKAEPAPVIEIKPAPKNALTTINSPTRSLTQLLKDHGSPLKASEANILLKQIGYIKPINNGKGGYFWSVTKKGEDFGKNIVSDKSPRETQPHWYVGRFKALLREIEAVVNYIEAEKSA